METDTGEETNGALRSPIILSSRWKIIEVEDDKKARSTYMDFHLDGVIQSSLS